MWQIDWFGQAPNWLIWFVVLAMRCLFIRGPQGATSGAARAAEPGLPTEPFSPTNSGNLWRFSGCILSTSLSPPTSRRFSQSPPLQPLLFAERRRFQVSEVSCKVEHSFCQISEANYWKRVVGNVAGIRFCALNAASFIAVTTCM